MKKTIVLSQAIHPAGMEMIQDSFNVLIPEDKSQESFDSIAVNADAIILRTNVKVSGDVIRKAPNLKIISRTGAGVDNVDLEACEEKGVIVCNLPAVNNVSVAEHAVAMMLSLAKALPLTDKCVRQEGGWSIRSKTGSVEMNTKTVGVIGMGAIGSIAARICCDGFLMNVLAYDPYVKKENYPKYEISDNLEEVVSRSDFITLHLPSMPSTRNLINSQLISKMKPEAILVNCSRGDILDSDALYDALKEGKIAAAALDVFNVEPPDISDKLLSLPNVIVSPHSAALTKEAIVRMQTEACRQVISFFETGKPLWIYQWKK